MSYVRPDKTITDLSQTKEEIERRLNGFEEVSDKQLCYVPVGSLLRYIGWDKKKKKAAFRFGGILKKIDKEYVILAGKNGMLFSAQRYAYDKKGKQIFKTRFFRKSKSMKNETEVLTNEKEELEKELGNTIDRANDMFEKQNAVIKKLQKDNAELKSMVKKLKKQLKRK